MKDLLLYMAKSLVDNPDSVTVTEVEGETTVLELRVAPEDMGKLIGRQGRIAKEIRTIIKSVAQRTGQSRIRHRAAHFVDGPVFACSACKCALREKR